MTYPNGIALSPDEKTLYVANSDPEKSIWMAYPVKDDGKTKKSPPRTVEDDDAEDGDFATPKRDRSDGDDDQPL